MICTLSIKQDLGDWRLSILNTLNDYLQCRSVSESTRYRQDTAPLSFTERQNRWACRFQLCSGHQCNKTYSFCCFYLMKVCMMEMERNFVAFWSFKFVFTDVFFSESKGSLVCLHLLAVLVQVNGDSAVAKKQVTLHLYKDYKFSILVRFFPGFPIFFNSFQVFYFYYYFYLFICIFIAN